MTKKTLWRNPFLMPLPNSDTTTIINTIAPAMTSCRVLVLDPATPYLLERFLYEHHFTPQINETPLTAAHMVFTRQLTNASHLRSCLRFIVLANAHSDNLIEYQSIKVKDSVNVKDIASRLCTREANGQLQVAPSLHVVASMMRLMDDNTFLPITSIIHPSGANARNKRDSTPTSSIRDNDSDGDGGGRYYCHHPINIPTVRDSDGGRLVMHQSLVRIRDESLQSLVEDNDIWIQILARKPARVPSVDVPTTIGNSSPSPPLSMIDTTSQPCHFDLDYIIDHQADAPSKCPLQTMPAHPSSSSSSSSSTLPLSSGSPPIINCGSRATDMICTCQLPILVATSPFPDSTLYPAGSVAYWLAAVGSSGITLI
jgi:hypothetical protein